MKRPMTLIGFIIATVFCGIYTLVQLFGLAVIIDLLTATGVTGGATLAVVMILTIALCVLALVFNAVAISAWGKNPEGYKKKRGMVITATVFNFIIMLLLIIGMASGVVGVLDVLLLIAVLATNVLAYIDLGLEKRRVQKLEQAKQQEVVAE